MPSVCSLFSGIGGIDLGFIQAGFDIVWANEMDAAACRTYRHNFPNTNLIEGDIKRIATSDIPDCDVLTAGFPQFGYTVYYRVLASNDYGNLPQIRKRIYIVAIREDISNRLYQYPEPMKLTLKSSDIINRSVKQHDIYYYTEGKIYDRLVAHMKDRKAIYRITDTEVRWTKNQMCPTLTANMGTHKDRVHVVWDDYGIRKMTLRECLDFQGFPKEFYFPNTITIDDAYKQIGNTVSVPVIARLATKIKEMLMEE